MSVSVYADDELRALALGHAISLVNQPVYQLLGKCNTNEIASITNELVNIIKYGSPTSPATETPPTPPEDTGVLSLADQQVLLDNTAQPISYA